MAGLWAGSRGLQSHLRPARLEGCGSGRVTHHTPRSPQLMPAPGMGNSQAFLAYDRERRSW